MTRVKICGLSTADTLEAALDAGADMVGFVFFAPSPRNISFDVARALSVRMKSRAKKVALTVDADDATLDGIQHALDPDVFQLHGAESPDRVAAIRARFGRPVMKAIGVAAAADLARAKEYRETADTILFDAKAPKESRIPGGNGQVFDWTILDGREIDTPWMLSGGLTAENVGEALRITSATSIDVSSGAERAPGIKDPVLIKKFIATVRGVSPRSGSR